MIEMEYIKDREKPVLRTARPTVAAAVRRTPRDRRKPMYMIYIHIRTDRIFYVRIYACPCVCVCVYVNRHNRCDTCHWDGYRRWSPRRMRLVRHGGRTQATGPQTRRSRGYTYRGSRLRAVSVRPSLSLCPFHTPCAVCISFSRLCHLSHTRTRVLNKEHRDLTNLSSCRVQR